MRVTVVSGTGRNGCRCDSWLGHWKNFSGQALPAFCPEHSCHNKDLLGARVRKSESSDQDLYVVPLCAEHYQTTDTLEIGSACELVPANVGATCGKPK